MRHWGVVPRDPQFVAAFLPTAIDIVTGGLDGDRPVLDLLAERVKARRWRGTDGAYAQFHTPKPLAVELVRRSARVVRFAVGAGEAAAGDLEDRHIPTLFWLQLYRERVASMFTSAVGERQGRRFTSIALSRLVSGGTWKQAEARVVRPVRSTALSINRFQGDLRRNGTEHAFRALLDVIATELAAEPERLVDFEQRRRTFVNWRIPDDDWGRICGLAGINLGGGSRQRSASAWCWAELTACEWENAPAFSGREPDPNARVAYRKLQRLIDGQLGDALNTYIGALLGGDRSMIDAAPPGLYRAPSISLAEARPDLAAEWHPTRNGRLAASHVWPHSHRLVWWRCGSCPKAWRARVNDRVGGRPGCSQCRERVPRKPLSARRDLAAEWHPTRNGALSPEAVGESSHRMAWWRCACGVEWQATPRARTLAGVTGCRFCRGLGPRRLSVDPILTAEWHPTRNGDLTPDDVLQWSPDCAWWLCPCGREWFGTIRSRTVTKKATCRACRVSSYNAP